MSKRAATTAFLTALMLCGPILVSSANFAKAQTSTEVIGILNSDSSWTKANSPYTLTGPVAVNTGKTLTIEPGTTINLNNYYIQINGTLTAIGSSSSLIQFNGGLLRFTPMSLEWNDQAGAGCIVQYANFNLTSISASVAIKLDNNVLSGSVEVGDNSIISNSNISEAVTAGNFCKFTNNQVNSSVTAGNSSTIINSNIKAGITTGDGCSILSNTVVRGVVCSGSTSVISDNNIQGGQVKGGSITGNTISSVTGTYTDMDGDTLSYFPNVHVTGNVVSNNNITNGTIHATQIVTNNVILSGTYVDSFRVFGGWADYIESSPAITTTGSPTISSNTITGGGTYTSAFIFSSSTNIVPAIDLTAGGTATITDNTIFGNSGLAINGSCSLISNNIITGNINGSVATISNNTVYGSINIYNSGNLTISNNAVNSSISVSAPSWTVQGNTAQTITANQGNGYILDNNVTGTYNSAGNVDNGTVNESEIGINVQGDGTIERNIISNNTIGITVSNCTGIVLNNTITNNRIGIALKVTSSTTTINFNNIQSNGQSVVLEQGTGVNINGTYNWWGTIDSNAISQTIHDYKNDFNLGNLSFIPILNSANPQAIPNLNLPSPNPNPTPIKTPTATPTTAESPTTTSSPTQTQTENPQKTQSPSQTAPTSPPTLPTTDVISGVSPNSSPSVLPSQQSTSKPETAVVGFPTDLALFTAAIIMAVAAGAFLLGKRIGQKQAKSKT